MLNLIEQGLTNEEIAARLDISFGGAKFHVAEILSKLGVSGRDEAVRVARAHRRPSGGMVSWLAGLIARVRTGSTLALVAGASAALLLLLLALFLAGSISGGDSDEPGLADLSDAAADFEAGQENESLAVQEFNPDECVAGEDARNPRVPSQRSADDLVMPSNRTFASVEEAEQWLCMPIPRPRTGDLEPNDMYVPSASGAPLPVRAERSHDLATILAPNGGGHRAASISYVVTDSELVLTLTVIAGGVPQVDGFQQERQLEVHGVNGTLYEGLRNVPDAALVTWEKDGFGFMADTRLTDEFDLDDLLDILETVS